MDINSISEQKKRLRKELTKRRNSIAPPDLVAFSDQICRFIVAGSKYIRCTDILLYHNFGSEVKTTFLLNKALADGKNVYYPRVEGEVMNFYKITSPDDLSEGFKGILEPFVNTAQFKDPEKALIIVPGLGFGKDGYRIGYGRGFYDNFLSRFPNLYKIGIGFSTQIVESIPTENHDIQLDEIVTEKFILNKDGKGDARWI